MKQTLLSASMLNEAGYDVMLNSRPKLKNNKTGEVIPLTKKGGAFILTTWVRVDQDEKAFQGREASQQGNPQAMGTRKTT